MVRTCLSLILVLSLAWGCSNTTGPDDSGPTATQLAAEAIDSTGGTLAAETVAVTVPPGAFTGTVELTLSHIEDTDFADDGASDTYQLAGLPDSFDGAIEVRIRLNDDAGDDPALVIGESVYAKSADEAGIAYRMISAETDDGWLVATLPPMSGEVTGAAARAADVADGTIRLKAVTEQSVYTTPQGHFRITYPGRTTSQSTVQALGVDLEEAYTTILSLHFSYKNRTAWPVEVTVRDLGVKKDGSPIFGYSYCSMWGRSYDWLEFNTRTIGNAADVRVTAGHEFFHFVQALYDPRSAYSRAKWKAPHLWLDEACSVWVEDMFSSLTTYSSPEHKRNLMAPFAGMVPDAQQDAQEHGYGLSVMIEYLTDTHGTDALVTAYEAIEAENDPVAAIRSAFGEPVEWWEPFLRDYIEGDIDAVGFTEISANREALFTIDDGSDTLKTFAGSYKDLSGKVYVIGLNYPQLDETASIECSVAGEHSEVTLFKYSNKAKRIEFIGTDASLVTATNARALNDEGWNLLVLVTNSRNIAPYSGTTDITLTIRVKKNVNPEFTHFSLFPEIMGDFESTISDGYTSLFYPAALPYGTGTLTGTTFNSTWDYWTGSNHYTGSCMAVFDETFRTVLSIFVDNDVIYESPTGVSYSTYSFTGVNFPWYSEENDVTQYRIEGEEIENYVMEVEFEYGIVDERWTRLVDFYGSGSSTVILRFWKD